MRGERGGTGGRLGCAQRFRRSRPLLCGFNVMGYDGMRTLLVGNHRKHKSVSVVALFFGAMHYLYGFPMIVFTALFVLFMNFIYRKTKNLWVCMLVHFFLGQLLFTLQLQKIGLGL